MDHFDKQDEEERQNQSKNNSKNNTPTGGEWPQGGQQSSPAAFQRSFIDGDFDFVSACDIILIVTIVIS